MPTAALPSLPLVRLTSNEACAYRYSATTTCCSAIISHSRDLPSTRLKTPPLLCHYLHTWLVRSKTPPMLQVCRHLPFAQLASSKAPDPPPLCHLRLTQLTSNEAHAYCCSAVSPARAACLQRGLCLPLLCHHHLLLCHHLPLTRLAFYEAQDPTATLPLPAHTAHEVQDSTAALPPPPAPLMPSPAHATRLQQGL
jgi:hypothetical protein